MDRYCIDEINRLNIYRSFGIDRSIEDWFGKRSEALLHAKEKFPAPARNRYSRQCEPGLFICRGQYLCTVTGCSDTNRYGCIHAFSRVDTNPATKIVQGDAPAFPDGRCFPAMGANGLWCERWTMAGRIA